MNIALFTDTYKPDINGVVSSIYTLKLALEKEGHTVYVITTNQSIVRKSFEDNVLRLPGMELKSLYGYRMSSPIHLSTMNNEIKDMNLDIIHAHTEFGIGLFARICSRLLSVPLVSTYHTTYEDYTHYVNRLDSEVVDEIARSAVSRLSKLYVDSGQCVIAPSIKTREMLERYNINAEIFVIPTGLDLEKFDKSNTDESTISEIKEECDITDQKMLLFLGRIAKEKSVNVLIDTMIHVKKNQDRIKLVIVGDGPDLENLKSKTKSLDLDDYVYFTGSKLSDQVPSYYHTADMFASASTSETQGMTYIESLASGLIVFANDPEVVENLVIEGETGYLFTDSNSLYSKISSHLNKDEETQNKMKENAVEVTSLYDSRLFAERILEVYDTAIIKYQGLKIINRVNLKSDYVEIHLNHHNNAETIAVSSEDYYNLGLRKGNNITNEEYKYLVEMQKLVLAYDACIRKISTKDRSRKEISDFLKNQHKLERHQIFPILRKLTEKGLLDDHKYAEEQVAQLSALYKSYWAIKNKLLKKGISEEILEDVMVEDEHQELASATIIAEKFAKTVKNSSLAMKKQKIMQKLYREGFSSSVISEVVENMNFAEDELNQNQILKKVYEQAYKKYSSRYNGYELRNAIYRYLITKGFNHDRVYLIMSEREWNENEDY